MSECDFTTQSKRLRPSIVVNSRNSRVFSSVYVLSRVVDSNRDVRIAQENAPYPPPPIPMDSDNGRKRVRITNGRENIFVFLSIPRSSSLIHFGPSLVRLNVYKRHDVKQKKKKMSFFGLSGK